MDNIEFTLVVDGVPLSVANVLAVELKSRLETADPSVEATIVQTSKDHMDFGASLAVVLSSAAVTALARGIQAWLARAPEGELIIEKNGKLVVRGLRDKTVVRLVELLTSDGNGT
jgi:hypothetical protein